MAIKAAGFHEIRRISCQMSQGPMVLFLFLAKRISLNTRISTLNKRPLPLLKLIL